MRAVLQSNELQLAHNLCPMHHVNTIRDALRCM